MKNMNSIMNTEIKWVDWEDVPVPSFDKKYSGVTIKMSGTGLLEASGWEFYEDYLKDFAYEFQTCAAIEETVWSFKEWVALEYFFGQRISYGQFSKLAIYYYCRPNASGNCILALGEQDPSLRAFRKGDTVLAHVFDENSITKVTILRLLTDKEAELEKVGPVYKAVGKEDNHMYDIYYDDIMDVCPEDVECKVCSKYAGKDAGFFTIAKCESVPATVHEDLHLPALPDGCIGMYPIDETVRFVKALLEAGYEIHAGLPCAKAMYHIRPYTAFPVDDIVTDITNTSKE